MLDTQDLVYLSVRRALTLLTALALTLGLVAMNPAVVRAEPTLVEGEVTSTTSTSTTTTTTASTSTTTTAGDTTTSTDSGSTTTSTGVSTTTTTEPLGPSPEMLERLRELEALAGRISAKQYEVYKASIELDEMDRVLALIVEDYNLSVIRLEETKREADRLRRELDSARAELDAAMSALEERVVGTYKSDLTALDFLLATTDVSDFIRRLSLLISIARSDRDRVEEIATLRARSDRLLDDASRQMFEVAMASRALEQEKAEVEAKLAERQLYVDRLSEEVRLLVDRQRSIAGQVVPTGFDVGAYLVGDGSGIVKTALRYLGIPYVWGGATPTGFDCSGLVQYVFLQQGFLLPHYSRYQAELGFEVPLDDIQPADLVFFGDPVYHVGIYMGDGLFIHAPRTGDVVKVSELAARSDLSHIRRVAVTQQTASRPLGP